MTNQVWNSNRRGLAIAIVSAVIFGFWPPSIRGIYAGGGNIVFAILLTTWARALALLGFCILTKKPLFQNRGDISQAAIGGFFQVVSIATLFEALEFLPGPIVIIILFSHTIMLLFYLAWRGEIKLDAFNVLTTLMALAGLSLVLDIWHKHTTASLLGIGFAFLSAIATVSRLYVWGNQTKTRHPVVVGAECFFFTGVFALIALLFARPHIPVTLNGDFYSLLGSIVLVLGTFGMFYGIALLGSFRWSLFLKLEPVFTSLFSALLLGEVLEFHQYLGIAIVIVSLVIYQNFDQRTKYGLKSKYSDIN